MMLCLAELRYNMAIVSSRRSEPFKFGAVIGYPNGQDIWVIDQV